MNHVEVSKSTKNMPSDYKIVKKKKTGLKGLMREIRSNSMFLVMLLPGIILLIVFSYIPMVGVLLAFKKINYTKGFIDSPWVGFKNFKFFLQTPDAFTITRNTILYNVTFIFLGLIVAISCALALNELRRKGMAKFYQSVMFLPYFLSWIAVSYLLYAFLNPNYGFVNVVVLKAFGKPGVDWYSSLKAWPFLLTFLHMWKYTGYSAVVYLAAIAGIDVEFYEAASIDGATKWQQIINITIPCLIPVITILTILAVGRIFNADFGLFYQTTLSLGNGILKPVADVLDTYVYTALMTNGDLGMAAASGLYQAVIGFVLVLTSNYIVKKINSDNSLF